MTVLPTYPKYDCVFLNLTTLQYNLIKLHRISYLKHDKDQRLSPSFEVEFEKNIYFPLHFFFYSSLVCLFTCPLQAELGGRVKLTLFFLGIWMGTYIRLMLIDFKAPSTKSMGVGYIGPDNNQELPLLRKCLCMVFAILYPPIWINENISVYSIM